MASLQFPISLETLDSSKKFNSFCYSRAASVVLNRVNAIKVSRFQSELPVDESFVEQNPDCSRLEIDKGSSGTKKVSKREVGLRSSSRKSKWVRKLENLFVNDGEFDVDYSVIKSDLSLEHCNDILKRLERSSDVKTLKFFEWMRSNGKLKCNLSAFSSVFRVLGRRENWDAAEKLIQEMVTEFGCELNYQVFNTLIYACSKLGRVEFGAKWFRMMLEHEVQPNVATFGMLMGLYQKGWNVEEAEFTFSRMRNFGIVWQKRSLA
ncbi:putative pentatricopeptide [Rosa chinensis]|uniref:Putative pentatricopeptide n=1 Tax=Rosa chinensis TaxID=74649 RepID=A0A2P6RI48_ROSCH|nr:putative pentatricopeptide [Rosa chinensis]